MNKATKPQIMRDLRIMKECQLDAKREEHRKQVFELKKSLVAKHRQAIESTVKEAKPLIEKVEKLAIAFHDDTNIGMRYYGDSSFMSTFTSVERVERYVMERAMWYQGEVNVLETKLGKELLTIEQEWDNLLINCSTMTAQVLRNYLIENKIEVPCMQKAKEVKTLTVKDINLDLLFGGNRDDK